MKQNWLFLFVIIKTNYHTECQNLHSYYLKIHSEPSNSLSLDQQCDTVYQTVPMSLKISLMRGISVFKQLLHSTPWPPILTKYKYTTGFFDIKSI